MGIVFVVSAIYLIIALAAGFIKGLDKIFWI